MPRLIDFGAPHGVREFPDGTTDEQIATEYERLVGGPSLGDYAQQAARGVITGATREIASLPKAVGTAAAELRRAVGYVPGLDFPTREGEEFSTSPQASEAYRLGQLIEAGGEAIAPRPVPELEESFLATKVPQAVGSGVGFLLGGGAARLLRRGVTGAAARAAERELAEAAAQKGASLGTKALAAVSEGAEIGTLGAVSQFQSEYEKAIAAGADRDTALKAGLIGLPIGATEAIPLSNMLRRLDRFSDGGFSRYLLTAGKEAFEEALQEAAQNFASNAVEKGLYNEAKSLTDDLIPQAGAGGAAGFLLSTLTQALGAGARRLRKGAPDAISTRTETEAQRRQAQGLVEGQEERVRLRRAEEDRLEAQARTATTVEEARDAIAKKLPVSAALVQRHGLETPPGYILKGDVYVLPQFDVSHLERRRSEANAVAIEAALKPYGVTLGPQITLFNDPSPAAPAARTQFGENNVFQRIELNQAKLPNAKEVQDKFEHEVAHVGSDSGALSEPLNLLTPQERGDIALEMSRLGYAQGSQNEFDARGTQALVSAWANRTWFGQLVGRITAWANEILGIKLTRRAAEAIAVRAVGRSVERLRQPAQLVGPTTRTETAEPPEQAPSHPEQFLTAPLWTERFPGLTQRLRGLREDVLSGRRPVEAAGIEVPENAQMTPQERQELGARGWSWTVNRMGKPMLAVNKLRLEDRSRWRMQRQLITQLRPVQAAMVDRYSLVLPDGYVREGDSYVYRGRIEEAKAEPVAPPSEFQTRAQLEEAVAEPLLSPEQRQEARDLAAVQSGMVNDQFMGWWMGTPTDDADALAHKLLGYIADRRFLSDLPRYLSSLPRTTDAERKAAELAGATVLGHYGRDRATNNQIASDLTVALEAQAKAVEKLPKMKAENLKAHFLTAMFNFLTGAHRKYLVALSKAAPASENLQAAYRERLNRAQERLNEQERAPGTLRTALSSLAVQVPDVLLDLASTNNQEIITWALNNGVLSTVVPQDTIEWLLVDDGSGQPALLSYDKLRSDLKALKDILNDSQAVAKDIEDYEKWFKPSGKTGKISARDFAQSYFKMRTARDRAAKIAGSIEKEIDDWDTKIRGLIGAQGRLETLMRSPDYVATVREAASLADVVTQVLYDSPVDKTGVGLIDRELQRGFLRLRVPGSESEYVVDLYPSSAQEKENRAKLAAYVAEARQYAADNQDDPLLADEQVRLADYVEKFLLSPSFDPAQGFAQLPWMQIPGTSIRVSPDIFDHITSASGIVNLSFHTTRDVIERIGGRPVQQLMRDAYELDVVMKKIEGINGNPNYGYEAQKQAVLKAAESHGWSTDQLGTWDEKIAEPVLAAGQNNLGPGYDVGDTVVGAGVKITKEDMAALRLMKQWGDAVRNAAPRHIQDRLGELGILRKAVGTGRFTLPRLPSAWAAHFVQNEWPKAKTDAEKVKLLDDGDALFRRVVMGYLGEFSPELALSNNASENKSPLLKVYRRLAETEKNVGETFTSWDQVLDFLANEMVVRGMAEDYVSARETAEKTLLSEITGFIAAYDRNVLNYKNDAVMGGVPDEVVKAVTANNSFTMPRGALQAPSTFYSYSTATDFRRTNLVGSLRSLMNLKVIQSMSEAFTALQGKKAEMERQIQKLVDSGISKRKATKQILEQTARDRKASEIRYDYRELTVALRMLEEVMEQLKRFETSSSGHYQHGGIEALQSGSQVVKSGLLAGTQAIVTNTGGGTLLGPAMLHWQTGQYLKALRDILPSPIGGTASVARVLLKRVAAMVAGNPTMSKLLNQHAPMWDWFAGQVIDAAADWRRIQQTAEMSGMVSPYNLRNAWRNRAALKRTGGRITTELDDPGLAQAVNALLSAPGVRHLAEGVKATFPRRFDDFINYTLIEAFSKELDFLKKLGWTAFQAREEAASKTGANWQDLTNAENVLRPGDLGLRSHKALERYRQIFAPVGSLDGVLLDYYERTKGMTTEERQKVPLLDSAEDFAGLALYYASITNVPTETTRPTSLKGKGRDGVWRNIAGTFMGWSINAMKQLSKGLQTHSKDPQFNRIAGNFIGLAVIVLLMAAVGAFNWEVGDELTKRITDVSSARIQPGNIQDPRTAMAYFAQALVNTVPVIGSMIGSAAGVAFTGRGNPFDMTSQVLHLNLAADTYNTAKRIIQTGDATLPLADYARRWFFPPITRAVLNRLPTMRGLVDQQNAVRSLNASAPPGTEIKWGQRGGDTKYSPANDEIQKLIASAYEVAAHGGDPAQMQARLQDAIQAYVKMGRSQQDAVKAVASALAAKEPIRVLTGREMTPEEEKRWVSRMTSGQKADYDRAVAAWQLLSGLTGKDLNMVSYPRGTGVGGGRGGIAGIPSAIPRGPAFGRRAGIGRIRRVGGLRRVGRLRTPRLPAARTTAPRSLRRGGRAFGIRSLRPRRPGIRRTTLPRVRRISAGRRRIGVVPRRRRRQAVAA